MLFECNDLCSCNAITCRNRLVQRGLTQRFQVYKTATKGWGVKTLRAIPKGSYVCEYVGEILTDAEVDEKDDDSYVFDLHNGVSNSITRLHKPPHSYLIEIGFWIFFKTFKV